MGGTKFKMPSKDDRRRKQIESQPQELEPYYKQILKREHADDEEFNLKSFPFEELFPRWKGDQFDAHLMNAATGRIFNNKHHTKGEGTKKRANFESFDFAFCLEWIDRNIGGVIIRDRCYNQFTIKSNGCHEHPKCEFKDGPNTIYYLLLRGEVGNWGMLKDSQSSAPEDEKASWTYTDWKKHAADLAEMERIQAAGQGIQDYSKIIPDRMAAFEAWWRLEKKMDAKQGGAQAANARGYSLVGTRTNPPEFMSRQAGNDVLPNFSRLTLNESKALRVANTRQKFGKDASNGRPDLEAKRTHYQRTKKTNGTADKDTFLTSLPKDRKSRYTNNNNNNNNNNNGGRTLGA